MSKISRKGYDLRSLLESAPALFSRDSPGNDETTNISEKTGNSPEIKSFALTLQLYSAKAYEFVRRTFNYALPHQAQICRWYSAIPAEAGFIEPSFLAIKRKVESSNEKVVLSMMLDEMSIRKHIAWDVRTHIDNSSNVEVLLL